MTALLTKANAIADELVKLEWAVGVDRVLQQEMVASMVNVKLVNEAHKVDVMEVDNAIVILTDGTVVFTHLTRNSNKLFETVVDVTFGADVTVDTIINEFENQFC